MVNLVFCLSEGRNQWIEDEFGSISLTRLVQYEDSVRFLESYLSHVPKATFGSININLLINYKWESHLIDIRKISYIEITKRIAEIHVSEGESKVYKTYAPLALLEKILVDLGFVRISRFYVVSLDFIRKIRGPQIELSIGTELPVGRPYRKKLLAKIYGEPNVAVK